MFYQKVLWFKLGKEAESQLEFETGRFTLFVNRDDKNLAFIPALKAPSYIEAKRELIAAGGEIVEVFPGHKALYFRDPLGQLIDIIERTK